MSGRRAMLIVIALTAVTGVLAGLARLGWPFPFASRAMAHGPLMVLGVFGTVIALERAVALGRWAYVAPALGVGGAVAQVLGLPLAGGWLAVAMALSLVALNVAIVRRQAAAFTWLMLAGALVLLFGVLSWVLGKAVFQVTPAWLAFFALTIVAERLELSRLAPTPAWATRALVGLAVVIALSSVLAVWFVEAARVTGGALVLAGAWQLRFDLARRTLRLHGLPRFTALAVLTGALWLAVSGLGLAVLGLPPAGPIYDALLHGVFIGFVLSMVFAHAPIILPAVARIEVPFHPALYAPLAVLHLGLIARVTGDLLERPSLRSAGGLINGVSLVLFALTVVATKVLSARPAPAARSARPTAPGRTSGRAPS